MDNKKYKKNIIRPTYILLQTKESEKVIWK